MLIKNGTINTMAASGIIKADIRVQDGRIAAVGENLKEEAGELIIDASGKQVFPGMVEAHCHLGMEESAIRGEGDDVNEMSDPITPRYVLLTAVTRWMKRLSMPAMPESPQ